MQFSQWLQQWGPSYWLTRGAGWLAQLETPWLKDFLIEQYINFYRVDMTSAIRQDARQFLSFQDFFTRELKPAARPIHAGSNAIVSPVDGTVASCGPYANNTLIQYKNTATNLFNLTGSSRLPSRGQFAILYLSPRDYHRIHAPVDSQLAAISRTGGSRYSVNSRNHRNVDGLYERNVRVNCFLHMPQGEILLVLVGAMIVSSIQTVWDDQSPPDEQVFEKEVEGLRFEAGDEIARFCLGSTAILLVPDGLGDLNGLSAGQFIRMGEAIGTLTSRSETQ